MQVTNNQATIIAKQAEGHCEELFNEAVDQFQQVKFPKRASVGEAPEAFEHVQTPQLGNQNKPVLTTQMITDISEIKGCERPKSLQQEIRDLILVENQKILQQELERILNLTQNRST